MSRIWKAVLTAIATLVVAGTVVGFVAAQTDGEVPGKERFSNFVGRLAENLGITQEELEGAIDQTQLDIVDEKLADGTLTEEQAAEARERIESGEGGFFGAFGHGFRKGFASGHGFGHLGAGLDDLAGLLEMSVDDLRAALADGQSLAQIAEAQGVGADKLTTFLLGELEARLAEAVESGKIDQARADEMLAGAPERIDQLINHEGLPKSGPHRFGPKGGEFGAPQHGFPERFRSGFPLEESADSSIIF
jgi:hypothetical protein